MNHFRIKKLRDPISIREAASKLSVDKNFIDPNIIKNTTFIDFNDKNLDNVQFFKGNSLPAINQHLTANFM